MKFKVKIGDKVRLKRGVNLSTWAPGFVQYLYDNNHILIVNGKSVSDSHFYIKEWGHIPCEYFELVNRRKEKLRLP